MATQWTRRRLLALGGAVLAAAAWLAAPLTAQDAGGLPEFSLRSPDAWINSKPLSRADLRGKVVLLEIYTSG